MYFTICFNICQGVMVQKVYSMKKFLIIFAYSLQKFFRRF